MSATIANLPPPLAEQLEKAAARLSRSPDSLIEEAVTAWLDEDALRHRLTLEALADVDAGRIVEHGAVLAWARSLGTDQRLPPPSA